VSAAIASSFAAVAELAKRDKITATREWRPGRDQDADLHTHVVVVRDGEPVALVYAGDAGPLSPRRAGYLAACFMRPDELFFISDSISTEGSIPPEEAEDYEAGSMFAAWKRGDRKGLTEALVIWRFVREGGVEAWSYPYVRDKTHITWGEPRDMHGAVGAVADLVGDGWKAGDEFWSGPIGGLILAEGKKLDADGVEAEWHTDRACARVASERDGGTVIVLEPWFACFTAGEEVKV
jgi:hypothetical protein